MDIDDKATYLSTVLDACVVLAAPESVFELPEPAWRVGIDTLTLAMFMRLTHKLPGLLAPLSLDMMLSPLIRGNSPVLINLFYNFGISLTRDFIPQFAIRVNSSYVKCFEADVNLEQEAGALLFERLKRLFIPLGGRSLLTTYCGRSVWSLLVPLNCLPRKYHDPS